MESQNREDDEITEQNDPSGSVAESLESINEASSVNSAPRVPCRYGGSCYRRNEDHKKEFSHPNDPDYNNATGGVPITANMTPDTRPECKYGTLCYRQNPQHKNDFKHTTLPAKKRVKKKVNKDVESGQESSDDYDFDDPFINDNSSDDYRPTSSSSDSSSGDDEDMEEDTKRTLREGNKFAKQ